MRYIIIIILIAFTIETTLSGALSDLERHVVASCVILESASEGVYGMRAVLNVIWNRSDHRLDKVFKVVIKPWQFSCMHSIWGKRNPDYNRLIMRAQRDRMYASAFNLVLLMEKGFLQDNTQGSTYYHTKEILPWWSKHYHYQKDIGSHVFYSDKK